MMLIGIIPTEIHRPGRPDVHDGADTLWPQLFQRIGMECVILPLRGRVETILVYIRPHGILLSGGGFVSTSSVDLSARDHAERSAVAWAERNEVRVFGVCRGFQFLHVRDGGRLDDLPGHVKTRHALTGTISRRDANSFHELGIVNPIPGVETLALAPDGSIEAAMAEDGSWMGTMWHPERSQPLEVDDLYLIESFFRGRR